MSTRSEHPNDIERAAELEVQTHDVRIDIEEDIADASHNAPTSSIPAPRQKGDNSRRNPIPEPFSVNTATDTKPWKSGQPYAYYLDPPENNPWFTLKEGVDKHDDAMCKAWKDDLETMLVFTGLFSAILTAFCVESLQLLSKNSAESTNALLLIISQQLANSTVPPATQPLVENFSAVGADIWTNVLYFISLTLALSVSSACILGKQWIREYQKNLAVSSCDALRVRQLRFDGLHTWKVPQILAALPVILQAALIIFFAGLLNQLWHLDNLTVACFVSVVVFFTLVFVIGTTVLPAFYTCHWGSEDFVPFRSPQAWIFFTMYQQFCACLPSLDLDMTRSWSEYEEKFLKTERVDSDLTSIHLALRWAFLKLRNLVDMEKAVFQCMSTRYLPSKRGICASPVQMGRYILSGETSKLEIADTIDRVYSDLCASSSYTLIDRARGRFQAELLVRNANEALDCLVQNDFNDSSGLWRVISTSCHDLVYDHQIFYVKLREEAEEYMQVIHDQIALMARNLLLVLERAPSLPSEDQISWFAICVLITQYNASCRAPICSNNLPMGFVGDVSWGIVVKHRNFSFIFNLASACCSLNTPDCLDTFDMLDKRVTKEWQSNPVSEEALLRWREFRMKVLGKRETHGKEWLGYAYLSDRHPCPALDSLEDMDPSHAHFLRTGVMSFTRPNIDGSKWTRYIPEDVVDVPS